MIRRAVPEQCIFCGTAGQVAASARTVGGAVVICWRCAACNRDWPAPLDEAVQERRTAGQDRRRHSRTDRRGRSKSTEK